MSFRNVSAAIRFLLFSSLNQLVTKTVKNAGVAPTYMPHDLMSFKNVSNHSNNHLDVSVNLAGNRTELMSSQAIDVVESLQAPTDESSKTISEAR